MLENFGFLMPSPYEVLGLAAGAGVFLKLMVGCIYKRGIRELGKRKQKTTRWLGKVNEEFKSSFGRIRGKNIPLFVMNQINKRSVLGINLKELDEICGQMPVVIAAIGLGYCYFYINERMDVSEIISFGFFTATLSAVVYALNKLINNEGRQLRLQIALNEYLENNMYPKMLSGTEEMKLSMKEGYPVSQAAASLDEEENGTEKEMTVAQRRKRLKAEKLKLKRQLKAEKAEARKKRAIARELLREEARKKEYEDKLKKLHEKYDSQTEAAVTSDMPEEEKRKSEKDPLDRKLSEIFPEKKSIGDEQLIEEVLKEYLFK